MEVSGVVIPSPCTNPVPGGVWNLGASDLLVGSGAFGSLVIGDGGRVNAYGSVKLWDGGTINIEVGNNSLLQVNGSGGIGSGTVSNDGLIHLECLRHRHPMRSVHSQFHSRRMQQRCRGSRRRAFNPGFAASRLLCHLCGLPQKSHWLESSAVR